MPINPVAKKKDAIDEVAKDLDIASTVGSIGSSIKNIMSPRAESAMNKKQIDKDPSYDADAMERRKKSMRDQYNDGGSASGY